MAQQSDSIEEPLPVRYSSPLLGQALALMNSSGSAKGWVRVYCCYPARNASSSLIYEGKGPVIDAGCCPGARRGPDREAFKPA